MNGGIGFGGEIFDGLDQPSSPTSSSSSTPAKITAVNSPPRFSVGAGGRNYIEHTVSKFDTLAGVAIKYGVEVADIKRINGLVSDLQMFALKTLQIPLPGRHPPSPNLCNGLDNQRPRSSEGTHCARRHSDLFDSFQSLKLTPSPQRKVSPAMSSLQGFYGLKTTDEKSGPEGFEMAVYQKVGAHYLEDGPFSKPLGALNPPLSHHRKSRSVANGLTSENGHLGDNNLSGQESTDSDSDNWIEKLLVRRRQKSETDFNSRTPEMLLKEDNSVGSGFLATKGKGLALRPKSGSRTLSGADAEAGLPNPIPTGLGDSFVIDSFSGVRKSSSASSLQDSDSNALSSLWPTSKWSLKPDLQALSTAVITRPIFDGLPKPITGRKNKAALD